MSSNFRQRRGALSVLGALTFILIAGMAAFAIDVGHILYARSKLMSAAENGAIAAVHTLPDSSAAVAQAQQLGRLNYGGGIEVVSAGDVEFGQWDADSRTFVSTDTASANAVRVTARLSQETNNPLPLFLGHILGRDWANVAGQAVVSREVFNADSTTLPSAPSVFVTSTKDLSNIVLEFADGSHQKFEGFSNGFMSGTFSGTGEFEGMDIVGVWIKSGRNDSGDGPGYGERIENPFDGSLIHGENEAAGAIPHVTATFVGEKVHSRLME